MSQKIIQIGLVSLIITVLGGTATLLVKMTSQNERNVNTSVPNLISEQTANLSSVHKNIKVKDPNRVTLMEVIAAKEKLKPFPSVITLSTDEELKMIAIAYSGNDTDDARHLIQIFRLQFLQAALPGYRGVYGSFPESLQLVISNWSIIVDYCVEHETVCNGSVLEKDVPPVITDIYTDKTFVYSSTSDNFTLRYFLTGCDSLTYCEGDEKYFVEGENIMTKDGLSTYIASQKK